MITEEGALGQATFSPCYRYRYSLDRKAVNPPRVAMYDLVTFLMLNPSTADANVNDNTVAKCCVYAGLWGARNLTVVNAFGFRSTDPDGLRVVDDPIGPDNNASIMEAVTRSSIVVCAWGKHGRVLNRGKTLTRQLLNEGIQLSYLKLNKDGSPSHPLYLPLSTMPVPWSTAGEYADG